MAINPYTEDDIVTNTGLAIIRRRPSEFIPDMEQAGLTQLIIEVQDNAFDEATLMGERGRVDIALFADPDRGRFQCVVQDNGRGIPINSLMSSLTVPHTSGKYTTDAYTYSSGLFGVGAKVAAGLALRFRAITCRGTEGTASLVVEQGVHGDRPQLGPAVSTTGTTVAMDFDPALFLGVDTYAETGWPMLLERIRKYAYFHPAQVRFLLAPFPLADEIWTLPNDNALLLIRQQVEQAQVVFDAQTFDREAWLRQYLGINRPFTWAHQVGRQADKVSSLAYTLQLYYAEGEPGYGRFGMINAVPIDAGNSNHISEVLRVVNEVLEKQIPSREVRTFFRESYKVPLYLAVEVQYEGAELTGTTKHAFYSAAFREEYGGYLREHFSKGEGLEALKQLYTLIAQDIQDKYLAALTGQTKVKVQGRIWERLNFRDKFRDANTKDRSRAELFIVEGDSAGGGLKNVRDGETQGIYTIRGKPFNALKRTEMGEGAGLVIQADPIYQDLILLLGIDPRKPDMNALYFNRVVILTDSDADGKHIASVLIGNLYALCPELVLSGRVQVVLPPYYGVTYMGQRGGAKKKQYLADKPTLIHWFTQHVYKPSLDIDIKMAHTDPTNPYAQKVSEVRLDGKEYDDFITLVMQIGEKLTNLAQELVIDPLILEMLTHITGRLLPGQVDAQQIQQLIAVDRVLYDADRHVLTLAIGRDDYTIPLYHVVDRLYTDLLPLLNAIHWKQMEVYITSKNHPGLQKQFMTLGQLYDVLKSFDSLFYIKQYKGLGGMDPQDCYATCMDVNHRTTYPITSLSDVEMVYQMLGRDSEHRKRLLTSNGPHV